MLECSGADRCKNPKRVVPPIIAVRCGGRAEPGGGRSILQGATPGDPSPGGEARRRRAGEIPLKAYAREPWRDEPHGSVLLRVC